jgi:hypothetical protein
MSPSFLHAASAAALLLSSLVHADVPIYTDAVVYNSGALGNAPNQTFISSDIVAPIFQVSVFDTANVDPAPYLFLALTYNGKGGPMIFNATDLSLVYADQKWPGAFDARIQTLNGTRYLTFWEGVQLGGHANGYCAVYDETYTLKYNLTAVGLSSDALADLHEFQFTEDGTALITIYENIPYNTAGVNGPTQGLLMDNVVQEIDVATGALKFQWRASDHFSITDTFGYYSSSFGVGEKTGFDFFHINSVAKVSIRVTASSGLAEKNL